MPCFRRIGFDFEAREPAHMPAGITKRGGRDGARPSRVPILLARTVDLKKCRRCTGSVVTWCEAKDGTVAEAPCLPSESTPIGLPRSVHTGVSPTDRLGPNQPPLPVAKRGPSVSVRCHRADDTPLRIPVRDDLRRAHPRTEANHGDRQPTISHLHAQPPLFEGKECRQLNSDAENVILPLRLRKAADAHVHQASRQRMAHISLIDFVPTNSLAPALCNRQ